MDLLQVTALELGRKIRDKEITAVEAAEASLAQIRKVEDTVHAYVTVDEEGALLRARQVQEKIEAGELAGPLAGVPVAVKDNMCTKGMRTTIRTRILPK